MREHDLQPRRRRRYVATIDSHHGQPIFPRSCERAGSRRPDQLWVADPPYVAITGGFAYVAITLDAWSPHRRLRSAHGYLIPARFEERYAPPMIKSAAYPVRRQAPLHAWVKIGRVLTVLCLFQAETLET